MTIVVIGLLLLTAMTGFASLIEFIIDWRCKKTERLLKNNKIENAIQVEGVVW